MPGYTFIRQLGRGGQALVYLAIQKSTGRTVAIKVIREGPLSLPDSRARFQREVSVLARLHHPNIVTIHDSGEAAGFAYFVMDHISGQAIDEYMLMRPVSLDRVAAAGRSSRTSVSDEQRAELRFRIEIFAKLCAAVGAAHQAGIVHRDIKPSNIRIDAEREPHVLDFGLALSWERDTGKAHEFLTHTGQFLGTLRWASPEQVGGHTALAGPASDVYSLGVLLYQLLTGTFPYKVDDSFLLAGTEIISTAPRPPRARAPVITSELEAIILKCLEKAPERRYADANELAADLERFLAGKATLARPDTSIGTIKRQVRTAASKHRITAALVVLMLATAIAQVVVMPIVFLWTPLHSWNQRLLHLAISGRSGGMFHDVRIVEWNEPYEELNQIAVEYGIRDVDLAGNLKSGRALAGAILEKLAPALPRAVAIDATMVQPTGFDGAFLRGVAAMAEHKRAVTIGTPSWRLSADWQPQIAPNIRPQVLWGCLQVQCDEAKWAIELAQSDVNGRSSPSFALASVCAALRPEANITVQLIDSPPSAKVIFETPATETRFDRVLTSLAEFFAATTFLEITESKNGLLPGDVVMILQITPPAHTVADASKMTARQFFATNAADLRAWCRNKIVLIADVHEEPYPLPTGGKAPRWYSHAQAIQSLVDHTGVYRVELASETTLAVLTAAVLGLLVGLWTRGAARWIIAVILSLAAIGVSVLLFRDASIQFDPLVPLSGLWLALILSTQLQQFWRRS